MSTSYALARLMYDVRYAGYWLTVNEDTLRVTPYRDAPDPLPDALAIRIRTHKPQLVAALMTLPSQCRHFAPHTMNGGCVDTACDHSQEGGQSDE